MMAYNFLDFGDEMPHSVAIFASALNEKKKMCTEATRRGVRMVKKKSKIDDKITKGRIADTSSMKNSVERMGQARLKNRAGMQPMANRARFRMPETKDEVSIPDDVETIKDLRHHIRKVLDVPKSSYFSCEHGPTRAQKGKRWFSKTHNT